MGEERQELLEKISGLEEEIRRLGRQLENNEATLKTLQREADLGRIIAGLIHDFNNFHTSAIGSLDLLAESQDIPSAGRKLLAIARRSAGNAAAMTRRLLDLVRRCNGDKYLECPSISAAISDLASLLEPELERAGITLELDLQADMPKVPGLCGSDLDRILINLVTNARHAMMESEASRLTISSGSDEATAWFAVSDTGHGLVADECERIFQPYYTTKGRAAKNGSKQAAIQSTGLGLTNCRSIVEGIGGRIAVESRPGCGTTITVFLPRHAPASAPATGKTVLIVDDDPTMQEILRYAVESAGCNVISAADGQEGLAIMRSDSEVHLVITDMRMPHLDGEDFLRIMRGDMSLGEVPVLLTSAVVREKDVDYILGLGATEFIAKPFKLDEVRSAIRRLLGTEP